MHELGPLGWRWVAVDLIWAVVVGLAVGVVLGSLTRRLVLTVRQTYKEAVGLDDFLALGLIALAYGTALLVHAYGFLAVFAAGLALSRVERLAQPQITPDALNALNTGEEEAAVREETAPAQLMHGMLGVQERLERIAEVGVALLVGSLLSAGTFIGSIWWFVPLLLLVLRPIAVALGLVGVSMPRPQRVLVSWFGIRGIGSLYYLSFAIAHGLNAETAVRLADLTLATIAVSTVVHGVSVTPIMTRYRARYTKPPRPDLG